MLLFTVVYGILSVITWSAFVYKVRDLVRDWRNRELQLLCLAIATFAAPFVLASPAVYVAIDQVLGVANAATLIIYICVAVCLTSFVALLMSWSSAQDKVRMRHRLLVGYSLVTLAVMTVFFFLGNVNGPEHPIDFDVHFEAVPYISTFLLSYQLLFTVSMALLVVLCRRYARLVLDRPWLHRGLRVVTLGAVFGLGYSVPKVVNMVWDLFGPSPLHMVSSVVAPMSASVAAALFSVGFTMPAWGAGISRARELHADYQRYRRIYPLWRDVADQIPEVVLFPPTPRTRYWSPAALRHLASRPVLAVRDGRLALRPEADTQLGHALQDIDLLLVRQVTEIRDAQLRLRPYTTDRTATIARQLATAEGLDGRCADAAVEAAQLAIALKAKADGRGVPGHGESGLLDPAAGDFEIEVEWLIRVADAYHASPVIPAALARSAREASQGPE